MGKNKPHAAPTRDTSEHTSEAGGKPAHARAPRAQASGQRAQRAAAPEPTRLPDPGTRPGAGHRHCALTPCSRHMPTTSTGSTGPRHPSHGTSHDLNHEAFLAQAGAPRHGPLLTSSSAMVTIPSWSASISSSNSLLLSLTQPSSMSWPCWFSTVPAGREMNSGSESLLSPSWSAGQGANPQDSSGHRSARPLGRKVNRPGFAARPPVCEGSVRPEQVCLAGPAAGWHRPGPGLPSSGGRAAFRGHRSPGLAALTSAGRTSGGGGASPRSRMISLAMNWSMPRLCSGCRKDRNSFSVSSRSGGGLSA